jgi:hypothetical protein
MDVLLRENLLVRMSLKTIATLYLAVVQLCTGGNRPPHINCTQRPHRCFPSPGRCITYQHPHVNNSSKEPAVMGLVGRARTPS